MQPPSDEIIRYFATRGIAPETMAAYRVASDDQGNIAFPFYNGAEMVYVKFRRPRQPLKGEPKEWQDKGCKPILFGMDLCSFSLPLVITEGQIDALSLYEAGARNVVSVPGGCENLDWIEHCWDFLEKFKTIVLFGDCDEPGRKMVRNVTRRLDEARCMVVDEYPQKPDGTSCKDANEILTTLGPDALMATLASAKAVPLKGVIQLAEVTPYDPTSVPRIKTMIPALDEALGGLIEGGMTVFTGKPGDGKL